MIPTSYKPIDSDTPPSTSGNNTEDANEQNLKRHQKVLRRIKSIDRGFVVSKLFYFFFYIALGALFPFFALYYKQLWLSPLQTGLLLALRPLVKLVCLPLWRMVTDRFSKPKVVYFISIFGWLIGYYGQTFVHFDNLPCYMNSSTPSPITTTPLVPLNRSLANFTRKLGDSVETWNGKLPNLEHLEKKDNAKVKMDRDSVRNDYEKHSSGRELISAFSTQLNGQERELQISHKSKRQFDKKFEKKTEQNIIAQGNSQNPIEKSDKQKEEEQLADVGSFSYHERRAVANGKALIKGNKKDFIDNDLTIAGDSPEEKVPAFRSSSSGPSPRPKDDLRVKFNFWIFRTLIVIVILTEIITTPTPMLADSAVLQAIAHTDSEYGKQRLFGSLGLALAAVLVAVWSSYYTDCSYTDTVNYLPCFYLFEIALAVTMLVSLFLTFETPQYKEDEISIIDALKLFKSPRAAFFLTTIFILGFCHSVQISFLFWFLQDLGGTPVLFGVIIFVYCFSEVVMYFLSNYIVQGIGQQGTLCLALACYTARFLMYGNLNDPWLVIPMELVQGVTYGGVWSIASNYVEVPEEASLMAQSILHGAYWGVGMAAGSLISGVVIQYYDAQSEFMVMAAIVFALLVIHMFIEITDRVEAEEQALKRSHDSDDSLVADEKDKASERFIGAAAAPLVPCLLYGR